MHFKYDTNILKLKEVKRYHINTNQKEAGVTILISEKAEFK